MTCRFYIPLIFSVLTTAAIFPLFAEDASQIQADGTLIVNVAGRQEESQMAVWPKDGLPGRPLLIAAHGNGGSGPKEIQGWRAMAEKHNFTIVCPTFLSSVQSIHVYEDKPYFAKCLEWIKHNLQYDQGNVFMTGMSGGGYPTWYLATQYPHVFKGLYLQSGNFLGEYYDLDLSRWKNKPIHIIWGANDFPNIPVENAKVLDLLKKLHCKKISSEVIPNAGHQEHQDMVAAWVEQQSQTNNGAESGGL